MKQIFYFTIMIFNVIFVLPGQLTDGRFQGEIGKQELIRQQNPGSRAIISYAGNRPQYTPGARIKGGTGSSGIEKDEFGGLKISKFEATGFFRLEKLDGRWFLVTPQGHPFYIVAIDGVTPWYKDYKNTSFETRYKKRFILWANIAVDRISWLGFNTLAHKTAEQCIEQMVNGNVWKIPFTALVPFVEKKTFPDVFSEDFRNLVDRKAKEYCEPLKEESYLVGYFLGNELDLNLYRRGEIDWRTRWVRALLSQEPDTPARRQFAALLEKKFHTIDELTEEFGELKPRFSSFDEIGFNQIWPAFKKGIPQAVEIVKAYNAQIAERFYKLTSEAIKRYDGNHLILGSRFANDAEIEVLNSTRDYTDVVSFNKYPLKGRLPVSLYEKMYGNTEKPLFHTEFSYLEEGRDGNYPPAPDQETRGLYYTKLVRAMVEVDEVVGYGWHEMFDPKYGSNFGLFDVHDELYYDAAKHIMEANRLVERRFAEIIAKKINGRK